MLDMVHRISQLIHFAGLNHAGWSYKAIERYEELENLGIPDSIREYTDLGKDTALPMAYRKMLYAKTAHIWHSVPKPNPKKTSEAWDQFMLPGDLQTLTPLNCPLLRFPSMSMLLPFRGIETVDFQNSYHNVSHYRYL